MFNENNNGGTGAQGAPPPTSQTAMVSQTKPAAVGASATSPATASVPVTSIPATPATPVATPPASSIAPTVTAATPASPSDKKKNERISFPKKVKIMYDTMCKVGISQANAIFSVGEYFKSLDQALAKAKSDDKAQKPENIKMPFSDKQIRIINVFLNEGYDAGKGADAEAISDHRQSKVAVLVGAMCDILRKEHNIRLASMLAVIAVNPKYISEFAATLGKPA